MCTMVIESRIIQCSHSFMYLVGLTGFVLISFFNSAWVKLSNFSYNQQLLLSIKLRLESSKFQNCLIVRNSGFAWKTQTKASF